MIGRQLKVTATLALSWVYFASGSGICSLTRNCTRLFGCTHRRECLLLGPGELLSEGEEDFLDLPCIRDGL